MSARVDLLAAAMYGFSRAEAEKLIDDYAHELAEKQREAAKVEYDRDIYIDDLSMRFVGNVIDLIDPEAPDASAADTDKEH